MESKFLLLICAVVLLGSYSCSGNDQPSIPPKFRDNGRTVDSIKNAYGSLRIDFENWTPNDATDSSLTVCLINSKILPAKDVDSDALEFKRIASIIRKSLVDDSKYKSYYIIFVTEEKNGMVQSRVHTAGMDVPLREL